MSHLDPSTLAQYNSLADPNLQSYFSNERIRSHLKHAGLISDRGEIIPESEYRTRLARREHKKHVRHVLAENIVNRAIDMERTRQAEIKRQFEMIAKAAIVNNIKESRRRSGTFSGLMSNSVDMALLSFDTTSPQLRPKSANLQNELSNEQIRIPRIQSAHIDGDHRGKYSSKTLNHRRSLRRSKNRSLSTQNRRSPTRYPDSSSQPCQITMVYYGPKMKIDYDHLVFESTDEIEVMQQHCGGENISVYKDHLKPGAEFTFNSRRHSDYPFGLSFYVKGYIDSRISTCCEYKHRHGVRLGGDRGHFAIKSVKGSKPCVKCRFEKQARFKKYAASSKDKDDENKKSIIIPLPVSDQPKIQQAPIQIPVRLTSIPKNNYSEDFDDSDKQKHSARDEYSSDSTINERKSKSKIPKRTSLMVRKESSKKFSLTSDDTTKEKTTNKTWLIIFHTSNIQKDKNILVKFSLIANDEDDQTEIYQINIKQSSSDKQYSFTVKDIGKPEQIRLKISTTDDDDEDDDDIKWYLDRIELIDPKTELKSIFPCKQWIRPSQEKILQLSQEYSRNERIRKSSSSTNNSRPSSSNSKARQQSPKLEQKTKTSARSSSSSIDSKQLQTKFNSTHRISSDNQTQKSTSQNKIPYRITIYPSNDNDGEFSPVGNSRIFLRLNNHTKETNLTRKNDQLCPTFEPGEEQTFEIDLIQHIHEKPKKLTIGYVNSDITAMKWKLQKIVLLNLETREETTFLCKKILRRNETNFRAEETFEIKSDRSDHQLTPKNQKLDSPKSDHEEQIQTPIKQRINTNQRFSDNEEKIPTPIKQQTNENQKINDDEQRIPTPMKQRTNEIQKVNNDEEEIPTPNKQQTNVYNKEKSPSFQSMNDDEADYKKIFKVLDPTGELKIGSRSPSPTPRPKTRHGRQDQSNQQNPTQPVDPLIGLDDLADQTARSNDQQNPNSFPSTATDNTESRFKRAYVTNEDDSDDD